MFPTKDDIFKHNAIFTVTMPSDFVKKHKCTDYYAYRVSKRVGFHYLYLLVGVSEEKYVGVLDTDGDIIPTGKSELTIDELPVRLAERVVKRIVANDIKAITQNGFNVTMG